MIGRVRPLVLWSSSTRRLIVVVVVVALILLFLLPRQTQVLLQHLGRPIADVVGIPMEIMAGADRGVRDWWNQYIALQGVYEQNRELQAKIQDLEGELNQLREQALASQRFAAILDFQQKSALQTLAARVIGRSASNWYRGVVLNKGEEDGVAVEMGVITPAGVVGTIVKVASSTSIALLVTDPNVAVTGLVQRTRDEGIIQGTANGYVRMKYIPPLAAVKEGDAVVTSGLTGGFPRGLLIGQVLRVEEREGDLFLTAQVAPVVDFGKLEEVLILHSTESKDQTGSISNLLPSLEGEPTPP
ncbi:rod shape-determining protein MreC [Candidatus Nitronereus thalassa]|uniref:Cell shape-determining protein MreC n=1 Tax=Candidatus Nitronereus thalassa TaxID=3020898 RepID=A0ABU3K8A3_9BACT|nr:rod shape-determining protein MreC [Candidatus Nitronereus thalassa]MDT7042606.1 rod shape-determining protein MreC [Candidatus Nitronereus thalassa]